MRPLTAKTAPALAPALVLGLVLGLGGAAVADTRPDVAVQLLGWSPDGARYAFVRHRTAHLDDGRVERSERTFLREVDEDLTEHTLPLSDEEVRAEVAKEGFVVAPLARRQAGELAWVFVDEAGHPWLRFTVVVGERLSWELATRGADGVRRTLAARPVEDLYVDFEPDVYVAPGGGRALLVVGMRAPYRHGADIAVVPLAAPPPPPQLPVTPAPPGAREVALEPGDVVLRWEETDAVVPVTAEEDPDVAALEAAVAAPAEPRPEPAPGTAVGESAQGLPDLPPAVEGGTRGPGETVDPAGDPLALPPLAEDPDILPPFQEPDEPQPEWEHPEVEVAKGSAPAPTPAPAQTRPTPARSIETTPAVTAPGSITLLGFIKVGDIYGGAPIAGATVTLSTGQTATTNAKGLYKITAAPGTVTVTASARGYATWSEDKDLEPGVENWKSLALVKPGEARPTATPR